MSATPLDFYDDPTGSVLRRRIPDPSKMPQIIKEAQNLRGVDLDESNYALILFSKNGEVLKKFACADPGNTALSVIYFMENYGKLPEEAIKVASLNLLEACQTYDLAPPPQLVKIAASALDTTPHWSGESQADKILKKEPKTIPDFTEPSNEMNNAVVAGLVQSLQDHREPMHTWRKDEVEAEKTAAAENRYVLNGPPSQLQEEAQPESGIFLLGDKYEISQEADVKVAEAYFADHEADFNPSDRHVYCSNLVKVAEACGIEVDDPSVMKYASDTVGPGFNMLVSSRKQYVGTEFAEVLDAILEKSAEAQPEQLANLLSAFDHATGLDGLWGTYVPDPWYTVYHVEKVASFSYTRDDGKVIGEDELVNLTTIGRAKLSAVFDDDFVSSFSREPVEAFSALPGPTKKVIAGLV
jgi:hypothetical protein